mgnify:CR=1 FL=1
MNLLDGKDRRRVYFAMVAQICGSLMDLVGVMLIGVVTYVATSSISSSQARNANFDKVLDIFGLSGESNTQLLIILSSCAVFLFLAKSVTVPLLLRRILRFLGQKSAQTSAYIAEKFFNLPLTSIQKESTQQVAFAMGVGVNSAIGETIGAAVVIVAEFSLLCMLSVTLLIVDPIVTVFTVAYFGLLGVLLQKLLGNWIANNARTRAETEVEGRAAIQELSTSYREMFVGHHIDYYVDDFSTVRRRATRAQSDWQLISYIPKYFLEGALVVGAGLLTAAEFLTKDTTAAISTLVIFMAATSRVLPSILRFQGAAAIIRASFGTTKFTFEILDQIKEHEELKASRATSATVTQTHSDSDDFVPEIEMSALSFRYSPTGETVLQDVTLHITPGSTVAIVGPTGSGKSTLADLMLGVIDADAGEVRISGLHPRDAVERWPGLIGFVPQVVAMRDASIRENVALGIKRDEIDDQLVWGALDAAELGDYLRGTRQGLDTEVGERGIRLSGGQRQRLGLARALYSNPKLLVLDEATSALDSETEATIARSIEQLGSDVTRVTIAHRLATVMHADKVVYLEDGNVLAVGSFDEVRSQVPQFDKQASLLGL